MSKEGSRRALHISMKVAMSLDARIATRTGDAKWLSSEQALRWGHHMRTQVDAILVGANTVIADDPSLNVRLVEGPDPLRLVLDSSLRTPLSSKLYNPPLHSGTCVVTTVQSSPKAQQLRERGVEVLELPANAQGRVDLWALVESLEQRGVRHLLVEGGGEIHGAFLEARLVDRLYAVLTPWLLGEEGRAAFRIPGVDLLRDSLQFQPLEVTALGPDVLVQAIPKWESATPHSPAMG